MAFSLFASSKKDDRRKELSPDVLASVRVMADDIAGVPQHAAESSKTEPVRETDPNITFDTPLTTPASEAKSPFLADIEKPAPSHVAPPFEAEHRGSLPPADIPLLDDTVPSSSPDSFSEKGASLDNLLQQAPDEEKGQEPIAETVSREEMFSEAPESTLYIKDETETPSLLTPPLSQGYPSPETGTPSRPAVRIPSKALWFGVAVVAAVLLIGGGGYLFWAGTQGELPSVGSLPKEAPVLSPSPSSATPSPVVAPYAVDKPNYLAIDTETVTVAEAAGLFSEVARKMKGAGMIGPVEFVMTDKNNNPIAFSRLAYLLKFELSADFLKQLDEPFSVYVILDGEDVRLGLKLSVKDPAGFAQRIVKEESLLPYALRSLYTLSGETAAPGRKMMFKSGNHDGQVIRYVNLDATQNISLDYVLREKLWLIGTSKNSLRLFLDTMK